MKVEQTKSTEGKPKVPQANAPASKAKPKIEELKKADKQKPNKDDDEDVDGEESDEDESDDDEVCAMSVKYVIFLFDKLFTSSVFQCPFCCLFCLFGLILIYVLSIFLAIVKR